MERTQYWMRVETTDHGERVTITTYYRAGERPGPEWEPADCEIRDGYLLFPSPPPR